MLAQFTPSSPADDTSGAPKSHSPHTTDREVDNSSARCSACAATCFLFVGVVMHPSTSLDGLTPGISAKSQEIPSMFSGTRRHFMPVLRAGAPTQPTALSACITIMLSAAAGPRCVPEWEAGSVTQVPFGLPLFRHSRHMRNL